MVAVARLPGEAADTPLRFRPEQEVLMDLRSEFGDIPRREVNRRFAVYVGWLLAFIALGHVFGMLPAMLLYLVLYMRYGGDESWKLAIYVSVPLWVLWWALFDQLIRVAWPQSLLGDWFPALRTFSTLF